MDIILALFLIGLFLIFYFYSKRDFPFSLAMLSIILVFLPNYLSFFNIRYFTIINMVSLVLNIKFIINKQGFKYDKRYLKYLIIYLIILQFWSILNNTFLQEIQLGAFRTILGNLSIACMCFFYINTKDHIKILNNTIQWSLMFFCLYGIFCYLTSNNPILNILNLYFGQSNDILNSFSEELRGGLTGRIQGLTGHPLEYGGIMLCFFYLILYQIQQKKEKSILNYSLLCLIPINIFLTGSRAAIIGLLFGVFLYIYINNQISLKRKIQISAYFLGGYFILITYSSFFDAFSDFINSIIFFWEKSDTVKGSNIDMRLTQLDAAFGLISKDTSSYLFGLGDGWVRDYAMKHNGLHPVLLGFESILFIGLIEYGVVGFVVLTCGLFFIFFRLSRKYHISNISLIMIISFFTFQMFTGKYGWLTFLILISVVIKMDIIQLKQRKMNQLLKSTKRSLLKNI